MYCSIDFEDKFNNWEKTDPAELFSAGTKKDEANPKMRIAAHLKNESRDASELVLWLDCDREGENICYEVIQCCKNIPNKNIRRAHFSAITDKDIKAAMNNLGKVTEPNTLKSKTVQAIQINSNPYQLMPVRKLISVSDVPLRDFKPSFFR